MTAILTNFFTVHNCYQTFSAGQVWNYTHASMAPGFGFGKLCYCICETILGLFICFVLMSCILISPFQRVSLSSKCAELDREVNTF